VCIDLDYNILGVTLVIQSAVRLTLQ
jgi:hypothetical protein